LFEAGQELRVQQGMVLRFGHDGPISQTTPPKGMAVLVDY
jgi:hypothetical protein